MAAEIATAAALLTVLLMVTFLLARLIPARRARPWAPSPRLLPNPPANRPGGPSHRGINRGPDDFLPELWCGSIWSDGVESGSSSCNNRAEYFWMTTNAEVYCYCHRCHSSDRPVPNGRHASREEVENLIVAQQVMLS